MGLLRVILAHVVLLAHLSPLFSQNLAHYLWVDGITATIAFHIFFMISGFFTELLIENYSKTHGLKAYYARRFLKLLPVYYVTLALTVLLTLYAHAHFQPHQLEVNRLLPYYQRIQKGPSFEFAVENLFLFIPQVFKLIDYTTVRLTHYLFIPQAWSLTVEFAFMIIAPFLLRKKMLYVSAWIVAITYAAWMNTHGFYRNYFSVSLIYFMTGSLGYRCYTKYLSQKHATRMMTVGAYCIVLFLGGLFYYYAAIKEMIGASTMYWSMLLFAAIALPFIFMATKNQRWDKHLGELAYPIYLCHFLTSDSMKIILAGHPQQSIGPYAWVLTIIYSVIVTAYITYPMTRTARTLYRKPVPRPCNCPKLT